MKRFVTGVCLFFGTVLVGGLSPIGAQTGPKNLVSPTYRAPAVETAIPHQMTAGEARRLAATAELPGDHLKLANYYNGEADQLEAEAAAYEGAATTFRNSQFVKNLMSPTAPARYEFIAERLRGEAESDRKFAVSHEAAGKVASLR